MDNILALTLPQVHIAIYTACFSHQCSCSPNFTIAEIFILLQWATWLTSGLVSKLFANYISIFSSPAIMTYGTPGMVGTDLNSPFKRSRAIHQPYITIRAIRVGGPWNWNHTKLHFAKFKLQRQIKCIFTWAYNWGITWCRTRTIINHTAVEHSTLIAITLEATNQRWQFILNIPPGDSKCSYRNGN